MFVMFVMFAMLTPILMNTFKRIINGLCDHAVCFHYRPHTIWAAARTLSIKMVALLIAFVHISGL